jgi:hypothetical protein
MKTGKKPSRSELTKNQVRLIDKITIILAIQLDRYMREFKDPAKMMKAFSVLSSSEKNLARLSMGVNLKNLSHGVGYYHEEIDKQLAKILKRESESAFSQHASVLSKVLTEYSNDALSKIEGKDKIKMESPKSIPRKPGKGKGKVRREGRPVVYVLKDTVEDYKNILSDPQAFAVIHERLLRSGILEKLYELITKNAMYTFKRADKKLYNFLEIFSSIVPNMDTSNLPRDSPKLFKKAIKEELEEHKKSFVFYLLENPTLAKYVFFMFSLASLEDKS